MKRLCGFTFIELMVVIAIMGVLAALITGNYLSSLKRGRDARRKGDLEQVQRALEMYYEDNSAYPLTANFIFGTRFYDDSDGNGSYDASKDQLYMDRVPNDPTSSRTYWYISTGTDYTLYACLENTEQILPYNTTIAGYTCGNCYLKNGSTSAPCIWAVTSANISIP
jgi:type II secretion system protein G